MRRKEFYKEWLYELGYDDNREYLYGDNEEMVKFMRTVQRESLKEAMEYINFIEDVSDDWYIEMKNNKTNKIND